MSQIPDIAPHGAKRADGAVATIRSRQPPALHKATDADLVDELRGQRFAKERADERIAAIGAELARRGLTEARGKLGHATLKSDPLGRVDLKRLRAERPDICRAFAQAGSDSYWSVRTLKAEERA